MSYHRTSSKRFFRARSPTFRSIVIRIYLPIFLEFQIRQHTVNLNSVLEICSQRNPVNHVLLFVIMLSEIEHIPGSPIDITTQALKLLLEYGGRKLVFTDRE